VYGSLRDRARLALSLMAVAQKCRMSRAHKLQLVKGKPADH